MYILVFAQFLIQFDLLFISGTLICNTTLKMRGVIFMKFLKKLILFLLPILLLSANQATCFDITELKGTFQPLKQEFKHLSPMHGVIWWESGLILEHYTELANPDATKRLARLLFHDIQGILDIAQHDQKIAHYLTPAVIGSMIGCLEVARCSNIVYKNFLQETLCKEIWKSEALFELNQHCEVLDHKMQEKEHLVSQKNIIEKALGQFKGHLIKNCKMSPKEIGKLAPRQLFDESQKIPELERGDLAIFSIFENELRHYNHQAITQAIKSLEQEITKLNNDAENIKRNDLKKQTTIFVETLIASLDQCGFFTTQNSQGYLPLTPYAQLLGFLYKKAESREDLWHYFTSLEKTLNISLFSYVIDENIWKASLFTQAEAEGIIKNFETLSTSTQFSIDDCMTHYENWMFGYLFSKKLDLPNQTLFKTVASFHTRYPDCTETVIRALCNILMYDKQSQNFLLDHMLNTCPLIKRENLNPAFLKFYDEQHRDGFISDTIRNDRSGRYGVHAAWAPGVENLPWVCYKRLVDKQSFEIVEAPQAFNGFISCRDSAGNAIVSTEGLKYIFPSATVGTKKIDETTFAKIVYAGQKYFVFDPEQYYAVEVAPSLKNIVIVLNSLLGVNLFGDMTNSFFDKNFNSKYFSLLCNIFGWTVADTSLFDPDLKANKAECCIKITASNGAPFEIGFSKKHARWALAKNCGVGGNPISNVIIALGRSFSTILSRDLEYSDTDIFSLSNLFFLCSDNHRNLDIFLTTSHLRPAIFNFLHSLYNQTAKTQLDNDQNNFDRVLHDKLVTFIVSMVERLDQRVAAPQELSVFAPIINLITMLAQSLSCNDNCLGLIKVLRSLLETKKLIECDGIKKLVTVLVQKIEYKGNRKALYNLHGISVEYNDFIYTYAQTREFILNSLQNDPNSRELFFLIQIIAHKGKDFDLCMQSIKAGNSQDIANQTDHIMILTKLLENWSIQQIQQDHQARFNELVDITHIRVEAALKRIDHTLTGQALIAAQELARKNVLKNELLDIITGMEFLNTSSKIQQINFFKDLVYVPSPQGYLLSKALEVAYRYCASDEIIGVRKEALHLLSKVIDKQGYIDNVCAFARDALLDQSITIRTQGLSLFRKILESITCRSNELQPDRIAIIFTEIGQSAQSAIQHQDKKIQSLGTRLDEMLQRAQRQLSGANKRKISSKSSLQQIHKKRRGE